MRVEQRVRIVAVAMGIAAMLAGALARADDVVPVPGTRTVRTSFAFAELQRRLDAAVEKNGMFVVTRASASAGAKRRGLDIPGNMVIGVYRNDFAVRMLQASVPAGIEAPLRFYLTENPDGSATLTYRKPSSVFGPYGSVALNGMARELDAIWARIVADTLGK